MTPFFYVGEALKTNDHLTKLKLGFNHFGPEASYQLVRSLWENSTLRLLGLENTSLKVKESSEGFGEDILQRLWNLKSEINFLKAKASMDHIEVQVLIEYPRRQRLWIYPPSELKLEGEQDEEKASEEETESIFNSVFANRPNECDSKWFFDSPRAFHKAFKLDWAKAQNRLQQMKNISAHDLTSISEVLLHFYVQLCDVFNWYAGVSHIPFGAIGLNSFLDMIRDAKLDHCREDAEIAFIASNYEDKTKGKRPSHATNPGKLDGSCKTSIWSAFV